MNTLELWPEQYARRKSQELVEVVIPNLIRRIEVLEAEVKRLEVEKAGKKGRKPAQESTS